MSRGPYNLEKSKEKNDAGVHLGGQMNTKHKYNHSEMSKRLKGLRTSKGYPQHELAKILDVDKKTIKNYESETTKPSIDILIEYSKAFNVPLDYLVYGSQENVQAYKSTTLYYEIELLSREKKEIVKNLIKGLKSL